MDKDLKARHWYLHVDLDAFFASVEQLDNPQLRGKPVIVGGKPEDRRSVVSTASYEARAFGVHSAMPVFQAYRLCPQGIFVHGRMHRYAELSHQIMQIFRDYSPDVDQMSIDEAFIDLTGTEKLFGPPEETARAIKARVKEETGLTVSVGLASTKYLAKIASGLSKPDGFFHIKAGTEESFMLNLPLNKVWGLGPKSLELIRSKGFNSTRDLYERDYDTLEFLFGKNMATFLYNVVRGLEKESFSRETKSHSISSESTFPYDLTDIYTIETELLELAQGVFFRLLKEESFSRTAFVKIRYDDFSTTTVQETLDRNIMTLDSYYEVIKRLFEKKYLNGRGIRLLGVGFENVVKEENHFQQDLFSINNDQKKQAVEKAILSLSQKHPEIKISRARTLKSILFAFFLFMLSSPSEAEDLSSIRLNAAVKESPAYLFDYDINDKNHVDFSASGLWKMDFTGGLDITFGKGTNPAAAPQVPVFKQETDISALLLLNNHWYFEAAFADEFTRNTFAFGYKGDGLVRNFRIANRGICMPQGYSAEAFGYSLQGGNNQAPGISLNLMSLSENIKADFLVRYDMTETRSEIYYGMNKVSDIKIRAEDFAYGREFHFPSSAEQRLYEIENIYIEDKSGTYTDARSRKYRKLRNDEYTIARTVTETRLFISSEAGGGKNSNGDIPSILVTFSFSQGPQAILSAAGSWNDQASFLGQIQKELGSGGEYNLAKYAYEMQTTLEGKEALIIQNYTGFSPFLCPCIYDRGLKKEADYLVIADKSEMPVSGYKVFEAEEIYTRLYQNFFDTKQGFLRVSNNNSPQSLYPFSQVCPEIYLGLAQKSDFSIRVRSYTPVTELVISKKAAAGTVQVYKNGILLSGIKYNENTGVIELNQSFSETDQLLVTWQEEANDFQKGAFAAGAGIKFDFLPELSADLSLTTRLPVNKENSLSENGNQKNSFTALTAGIKFEKAGFKLTDKSALSLLNENTSDGLLIYSWDKIWEDYQKTKKSSPDSKINEPEQKSSVGFSSLAFTAYKKIEVDFSIQNKDLSKGSVYSGPLFLALHEDKGLPSFDFTADNAAVILKIEKLPCSIAEKSLHSIEIASDGSNVLFDGSPLPSDSYYLKINDSVTPSRLTLQTSPSPSDAASDTASGATSETEIQAFIQKFTFNQAQNYGNLQNYASAEYKREEALIRIKDFDLLKNLHIAADSSQGSGNLLKPDPYVSLKSQAGLTLAGISFEADASVQNILKEQKLSEAGHSIKTSNDFLLLKILSAEDTYRYKAAAKELKKQNIFAIDFSPLKVPAKAAIKTTAENTSFAQKQNAELTAGYTQKILNSEIGLNSKFTLSQKVQSEKSLYKNYFEDWQNISLDAFSTGKENASSRENLWTSSLNAIIPFEKTSLIIKPKVTFEFSDTYKLNTTEGSTSPIFSDKEYLQFLLPFNAEKKAFSFEISRTGGGKEKTAAGGNYISDEDKLFSLQNDRKWFYTSIPFYELFDQTLMKKISDDAGYAAKYEGSFRRSLYNSKKDIIIPSSLTLALTREITKATPSADLYQIKLVITNNSINNFGKKSAKKHFLWFEQEELTTSLTTIMKLPANDPANLRFSIQSYLQLLLFISDKALISEQLDFSIENSANWNLRNTTSYSRPSQTSLVMYLAKLIFPSLSDSAYSITRKDSFTAEAGSNNAVMQQKYSYNHTVGIDFLDYYNINAEIGGTLILNQKLADRINLNISLGAKAEF